MTLITMLDAASPGFLAHTSSATPPFDAVAGYIDGGGTWAGNYWSAFPTKRKIRISVEANPLADVFDFETGTAGLLSIKDSVIERAEAYIASVVYCQLSNWQTCKNALDGLPVAWWVAAWVTGTPPSRPMAGACAWQYKGGPSLDFDTSVVDTSLWPAWFS
jgi:hypothetical protein